MATLKQMEDYKAWCIEQVGGEGPCDDSLEMATDLAILYKEGPFAKSFTSAKSKKCPTCGKTAKTPNKITIQTVVIAYRGIADEAKSFKSESEALRYAKKFAKEAGYASLEEMNASDDYSINIIQDEVNLKD